MSYGSMVRSLVRVWGTGSGAGPPTGSHILTEASVILNTETNDKLITE